MSRASMSGGVSLGIFFERQAHINALGF